MLRTNRLKASLAAGHEVFGLIGSVPLPLMTEMIGFAGFDFVILDLEHVGVNPETLENMIRAAECCDMTALVRVPHLAPDVILRVLDAGAQGIVVPHVRTQEEARLAVISTYYYPIGVRGIAGGRTTGFGTLALPDYFERANRELMVVVMIEDMDGVDAIEEIASTPYVDMVLEGAIDLSQSLGVPAQAQHPSVQTAIARVAQACQAKDVPFCAIPRAPGEYERWRARGVTAFLVGDDRTAAFRGMKQLRSGYRN
jgi:4-hydroxy-2-oxoheptanedioate aldolase